MNPERRVLGMMSPISYLFVHANFFLASGPKVYAGRPTRRAYCWSQSVSKVAQKTWLAMFHFGNYAVPSWHHLQIHIGHWNGTIFSTIRIFGFKISRLIKPSSRIVCKQHWDLFCYVAHLPEHRWVRTTMLAWNPAVRTRQVGRPRHTWDQKVTAFCPVLPLQTIGTLAGLRTVPGSMVGTF